MLNADDLAWMNDALTSALMEAGLQTVQVKRPTQTMAAGTKQPVLGYGAPVQFSARIERASGSIAELLAGKAPAGTHKLTAVTATSIEENDVIVDAAGAEYVVESATRPGPVADLVVCWLKERKR